MLMFYDIFFFFKQKTAYEMRISDWSSDVCSSDLVQTNSPVKEIALHADFIGVHRFNVIGSDVDEEGSSPIESAASKATRIRGVKQHVVARLEIEAGLRAEVRPAFVDGGRRYSGRKGIVGGKFLLFTGIIATDIDAQSVGDFIGALEIE